MTEEIGIKYDKEKLRWDLVPWAELEQIVKVITFGCTKYGDNNWQHVKPFSRYFAALLRHIVARLKGEINDEETGIPHLAHAGCNILFLLWGDSNRE